MEQDDDPPRKSADTRNSDKQQDKPTAQSRRIRELIKYARERDELGKHPASRAQLVAALMTLGHTRKEAEREIENARVRVRRAADKAERRLTAIEVNASLWNWTHPREAIRSARVGHFGGYGDFERWPLTDIEQALLDNGNVLWIIAVYDTLKVPILTRLRSRGSDDETTSIPDA